MRISDAFTSLICGYNDWNSQLLINRSFIRKNNSISWANSFSSNLPHLIRQSNVAQIEESGQYSFQAQDGSIFQLYYLYNKDNITLVEATLAYYNSGITEEYHDRYYSTFQPQSTRQDITSDVSEEFNFLFPAEFDPLVPWIRIDYSPQSHRGPLHHACHMHIGLMREARISLSCVPTPRQFIEFCVSQFYPEYYRIHRLKDDGEPTDVQKLEGFNEICFPLIPGNIFSILPHLRIPSLCH